MFTMVHLNCSVQFLFQSTALGLPHTQSPTNMQGGGSWQAVVRAWLTLLAVLILGRSLIATDTYCDRWSKLLPVLSFTRQQGKCHAWFSMHSNDFPLQCFIFKHAELNYYSLDFLLLWRSLKHLKTDASP